MKERNIALCIIFTIITCGIYGIYWFIVITDETNEISGNTWVANGLTAFILTIVTCNIYGWYWAYKMGEKVDVINSQRGIPSSNSGILFIILQALGLGIIINAVVQDTINKTMYN